MFFIRVLPKDGEGYQLCFKELETAQAEYDRRKDSSQFEVVELWREGNPSTSDLETRYSKMLAAWDGRDGDLDVSQFCRREQFTPFADMCCAQRFAI